MTTATTNSPLDSAISCLAASDRRYQEEAYHFVFRALDFVVDQQADTGGRPLSTDQHISALALLDGLREYALDLYGPLARLVLERWGVRRTEDFGEIVFGLVEGRLLNKQETDRKADFRNGFNFREAFDRAATARLSG
ncbi:MAG: hypothetical protein DHS20C15_00480 [Planctomycetota bacterium]|nr:MAG: hypothetical protein DHS20C15_00480 [Planctomycetota bacterium]